MDELKWIEKLDYPEYSYQFTDKNYLIDLSLNDYEGSTASFLPVLKKSITSVGEYSFAQDKDLIKQIRRDNGKIKASQILITAGADGALRVIFHAVLQNSNDKKICIPIPSFSRYEYHAKSNSADIDYFQNEEFPYDLDVKKLIKHLKSTKPTMLVLANPNNPTGSHIKETKIKEILKNYKGYLILDEALIFNGIKGMHSLTKRFKNLIIVRTFSKLYGIAGERIGYIIANESVTKLLGKLLSPFEVSSISIELAKAVISDTDTIESRNLELEESISYIKKYLPKNYIISDTKSSIFLLKSKKDINLYQRLLEEGIKTVSCKDFRGIETNTTVRISIKDLKSMKKLFSILERL